MLKNAQAITTLPVTNLNRAKSFYQDVLGLKPGKAAPNGIIMMLGKRPVVDLFHRSPTKTNHTALWITVGNFDEVVATLHKHKAKFVKGAAGMQEVGDDVYAFGHAKATWFKDSEGNIICVSEKF